MFFNLDLRIIDFQQYLCYEAIIFKPKYFFLNRRVFIKSMGNCNLKMFVSLYVSVTQTFT